MYRIRKKSLLEETATETVKSKTEEKKTKKKKKATKASVSSIHPMERK